jgi:hypothetical protein
MTLCELLDRLGACTGWTMRKHHAALLEIIEMAEKFGAALNSGLFLEQFVHLDDLDDAEVQFLTV